MKALISKAREFCSWCRSEPGSKSDEGQKAQALLIQLYSQAMQIEAPTQYDADIDVESVGDDEWKEVYARAAALPFQHYSSYFDPLVVPPEDHEMGDVADDIADIYRDLSAGLALFDAGHEAEAQWAIHFSFLIHWGRHASGAIRALHCWYADAYEF